MLASTDRRQGARMETAAKILILGGLGSLLFSFVMAFVLSQARLADPMADRSLLLQVHRVSLWEGFMLLGLVWAVQLSDLSGTLECIAAVLLVAAAALQLTSNTMAWRAGNENLFAPPRGLTYYLAAVNAVLAMIGLVILVIGALRGL
jgi:hypothetical protein